MSLLPLGTLNEDSIVILLFVLVALGSFTGGVSAGDNPLVWGFAVFLGVVFAAVGALTASGLGILLPVLLVGALLYLKGLGALLGEGPIAWVMCAFVIMLLAGAGYV